MRRPGRLASLLLSGSFSCPHCAGHLPAIALVIVRCRKAYSYAKAAILTTLAALIGRMFNTPPAAAEAPCAAVQRRSILSGLLAHSVRFRHLTAATLTSRQSPHSYMQHAAAWKPSCVLHAIQCMADVLTFSHAYTGPQS